MRGDGSVRKANEFFSSLTEDGLLALAGSLLLTERQKDILSMYYVKRLGVGFVSDTLGISQRTAEREIARIREKTMNVLEEKGYV